MIIERYEAPPELVLAGENHTLEADLAEMGWSLHSEYLHPRQPVIDDGLPTRYSPEPWNIVVDSLKEQFGADSVKLFPTIAGNYAGALIFVSTEQLDQARRRASEIAS